jgi:hypothetical protein
VAKTCQLPWKAEKSSAAQDKDAEPRKESQQTAVATKLGDFKTIKL